MTKSKTKPYTMSNKETLIAFCETLSESEARKAYIMLADYYSIKRTAIKKFNRECIEDKDGLIRLRKCDLSKLIEAYGDTYVKQAAEVIYDYFQYLEDNKEFRTEYKRKLRQYKSSSHYPLFKADWIADRVRQRKIKSEGVLSPYKECYDFYNIETKEQAIEYIKSIPSSLRIDNPEVQLLLTQYPDIIIGDS